MKGNLSELMQQAQKMQADMQRAQEELARAIEALLVCAARLGLSPEAVLQQVAQALEEAGKAPSPTQRSTGEPQ